MRGINKVIIVGTLGADPEVRYSPNGTAFANISVATNESWKDKQTGEPREHTEWHRVVFSARLAEVAGEYLRKGSKVYIEGKNHTRKWQDQSGKDCYITEIRAREMQMLDSRDSASNEAQQSQNYGGSAPQASRPPQQPSRSMQPHQQSQPQSPPDMDSFDDDIPF